MPEMKYFLESNLDTKNPAWLHFDIACGTMQKLIKITLCGIKTSSAF